MIYSKFLWEIGMDQETLRQLFTYDVEAGCLRYKIRPANRVQVGDKAYSLEPNGRNRTCIKNKKYLHAVLVWVYHNGPVPEGLEIDHRNRIKNDDHIGNLRAVTSKENAANRRVRIDSVKLRLLCECLL